MRAVTTIVLNGASSSGKSSLAAELQRRWSGALLVTGIDTFLAGFPEELFSGPGEDGLPGPVGDGFNVLPGEGPAPSWVPLPGREGLQLIRAAHRAWRAVGDSGQDQVVDHVLLDPASKKDAREVLSGPGYVWVGIRCDLDEAVRRESARGDRFPGFASGTSAVVHAGMTYDLELDVTRSSPAELAEQLLGVWRRC